MKSVPAWHPLFRRFLRFCVVGGSGVFVDMAVLHVLAGPGMFGWALVPGKVCAAEVAMINNFLWNDVWTFRGLAGGRTGWKGKLARFGKFNLICSVGIAIGAMVLKWLVEFLGLNIYAANLLAIGAATAWNFGMNCLYNWRVRADSAG